MLLRTRECSRELSVGMRTEEVEAEEKGGRRW